MEKDSLLQYFNNDKLYVVRELLSGIVFHNTYLILFLRRSLDFEIHMVPLAYVVHPI